MSNRFSVETFFRPDEMWREQLKLPAHLFNRCRLLLSRCQTEHVFVPVRSMQYLVVIDDEEFIFVDNQGGYAVRDGEGGRLIAMAWDVRGSGKRDSLTEPVPIELVAYTKDAKEIHRRLMSELPAALDRLEEKYRETGCEAKMMKVLPFQA